MHWPPFLVLIGFDLLVNLLETYVLWGIPPKSCSWFWVALIWMLRFASSVPALYGSDHVNGWPRILANGIFMWLCFFGGDGRWKKLWGKIRGAALTAVSQASFQRQTREVLS